MLVFFKKPGSFFVIFLSFFLLFFANGAFFAYAEQAPLDPEKRAELEKNLDQLEKEATNLDNQIKQAQGETQTLASAKKTLDAEVKRRELEIRRLNLVLRKTSFEIQQKKAGVEILTKKIDKSRKGLSASILLLYTYGQENPLTMLFKHHTISDFFGSLHALERVQTDIQSTLVDYRTDRELLEKEKGELEDFESDQRDFKSLQEVERRFLAQKKQEKDDLIRLTKGKEALFQQLLQLKKKDIAALKTQLFYLEKTGITAEEAVRLADLAAKRTGIRTAFLLALLEVETGKQFEDGVISVGTNLGTGNWKRDMYDCYRNLGKPKTAEFEKNAFFQITSSLGLDPDKMPVSRKPSYGCGGAMGPAQFIASTWLNFSDDVTRLTGHNPANPWSPEDAFTASAVFLAQSGAASQTEAGEIRAAKTYISGSPSCTKSICRYYSNRIIALAREIDRVF